MAAKYSKVCLSGAGGPNNLEMCWQMTGQYQVELWKQKFRAHCNESRKAALKRTAPTIIRAVDDVANQHPNLSKNIEELNDTFSRVQEFVEQLDAEIHHKKSLFTNNMYGVWSHIYSFYPYRNANLKELEHFLQNSSCDLILSNYFHTHQGKLQGGYLDWVLIDLLAAREALSLIKERKMLRENISYSLFDSIDWREILLKVVVSSSVWLLTLLFAYALLLFFQLHEELEFLSLGLVSIIIFSVVINLSPKLESITAYFSKLKSNKRQFEQVEKVYRLLSGRFLYAPLIMDAFKKTAEAGVMWDPRIFHLLENALKSDDKPWSVGKP